MMFNFTSSNSIARKLKQIKEKTIYSHTSCCGDLEEDDEAVESAELLWWVSSWFKYSRALSQIPHMSLLQQRLQELILIFMNYE